jgi:diacylglycerol kinase family enzyme
LHLRPDKFDVILDDKLVYENLETLFLQLNNGKLAGGRMILNPFGLINDGYMEAVILTKKAGALKMIGHFDK